MYDFRIFLWATLYDRKTFCAGFRNGTSAGPGDSGGGLYIAYDDGRWLLRGIVSSGKANATHGIDSHSYIVFTDVAYYALWIQSQFVGKDAEGIFDTPNEDFSICGKKAVGKFIRKRVVEERKWPWHGDVYRNGSNVGRLCEAVIISENFMLSAADAYSDGDLQYASQLMVVFDVFRNREYKPFHKHRITRIILHEDFQSNTRVNNIALLEMRTPLRFNNLLRPVCLYIEDVSVRVRSDLEGQMGDFTNAIGPSDVCNSIINVSKSGICFELKIRFSGTVPDVLYQNFDDSWYIRGIAYNVSHYEKFEIDRLPVPPTKTVTSEGYMISLLDIQEHVDWISNNTILQSDNLLSVGSCAYSSSLDWMFNIEGKNCFASLITPSFVLTTASCVNEFLQFNQYTMNLTSVEYFQDSADINISSIKMIHVHPSYTGQQNTIAIIELTQSINITPICLPKSSKHLPDLNLQSVLPTLETTTSFEMVGFRPTNIEACTERWYRQNQVSVPSDGSHICGNMIPDDLDRFECGTDSRSLPLFYTTHDGTVYLRGVLDIAKLDHCRADVPPEVFLDVMQYADWITDVISTSENATVPTSEYASIDRNWTKINLRPSKLNEVREITESLSKIVIPPPPPNDFMLFSLCPCSSLNSSLSFTYDIRGEPECFCYGKGET